MVLVFCLVTSGTLRMGKQAKMNDATRIRAPELPASLDWFNTEQPLTLASQRGKVVLLEFWAFG